MSLWEETAWVAGLFSELQFAEEALKEAEEDLKGRRKRPPAHGKWADAASVDRQLAAVEKRLERLGEKWRNLR